MINERIETAKMNVKGQDLSRRELAALIDHTNLKPNATSEDIELLCEEAVKHGFYAVCVAPTRVNLAAECLKNSSCVVATVIGFPLGYSFTDLKIDETEMAYNEGATEFDMVMNRGWFFDQEHERIKEEINSVASAARGCTIKVILETEELCQGRDEAECKQIITEACDLVTQTDAHFVKTSTGFLGHASDQAVRWMRDAVGNDFGVKASGGIRDRATANMMINASANRIGASRSLEIIGVE